MQRVRKSNAIVDWVNGRLEGDVQTLSELRNGVALLQLVYLAYPESFDLARVDFHAKAEYHCEKNLKLLQEVLQKNGVNRDFRIDAVVQAERFNDLFYLATFLHDLVERQLADRGPEDVPSDPVTERRRAEERRKLRFKPFRVAMLAGKSTPRRSIDALDDALSLSEHSQALTTYTTRATSTALSRRMRRRGEELELWVQDVRLPDPGQLDPCVHSPGRRVSPRGEVEALLPPCLDGGPVVAAWPNACDACTLELLPALGHVLYDDITTWPCDAAGTENSAGCAGVTSTHNSPTRAGGDALWCDFDAVLMAAGAS